MKKQNVPSWTRVPYPVGVKKAGIPAPPALIRSASVPCGVSSRRISPDKNWRSNSAFSPTYEAMTWLIWRCFNRSPKPNVSTPQLLDTTVKLFTFVSRRAPMRFSGIPHSPKPSRYTILLIQHTLIPVAFIFLPPTRSLEPERISLTASSAVL